ncbi:ATP-binding cassette domain-containing protein [Alkalihalobacillus trypoxylicola]|uniref:Multidrug ABC transporter ATP-binding protein n=1 Tax=Alkalihalobacillus trypoxylicola TaxID=519424 RepID=A0A162DF94_9BACI|nr:ABC transporter ATP-binding protein [Alkalihalobacillus trypoxylicola]KYG29447.1 multidrug ABC transporter ATP-binding protein [Alkalihalobacillus trypoxylicola]
MIAIENVSFYYGKHLALQNINLFEDEPVIIGLWGRNGSGKTTLMKLLSGQERISAGQLKIHGLNPYNNSEGMKYITYMQENHPFSDIWSVDDALRFGSYFNANWDQELANSLVEIFNLPRKKKIRKFSKGMQTMIKIVLGLASKAPVTILDEPTNGLDAHMRKQFYAALLETYEEDPRFILISSHHIDEIEPMCEKLAIVHNQTIEHYVEMEEIKQQGFFVTGEKGKVEEFLDNKHILSKQPFGKQLKVMVGERLSDEWLERARDVGVSIEKAPLQDYLVEKTMVKKEVH